MTRHAPDVLHRCGPTAVIRALRHEQANGGTPPTAHVRNLIEAFDRNSANRQHWKSNRTDDRGESLETEN